MNQPTDMNFRRRFAPSKALQKAPGMSPTMMGKPAINYDLDEEIVMTPVHTRAVSPTRGRVMPHTTAQAGAFMASLNTIVSGNAKDKLAANSGLPLTGKVRVSLTRLSMIDAAVFLLYIIVFTLTMVAIQIAMMPYGVSVVITDLTACG